MIGILLASIVAVLAQDDESEFTSLTSTYNEETALRYWFFSCASYCSQKNIENWSCKKPCSKTPYMTDITIFINATKENAGFSAYDPAHNTIVLVFRGTVPWLIKNWMEDINFIKTSYPYCNNGCEVHRGFYYSFQGIQDQVLLNFRALRNKYPNAQTAITGHSLGGALATHALVHLVSNGFKINHFYTFGSPRVGDKLFFQWLSKVHFPGDKFRVTHNHDPVPHLPMLAQGFHHINTEAYYKDFLFVFHKDVKLCNDAEKEDSKCSDQNLVDLSVEDHMTYLGYDQAIGVLECQ